MFFKKEIFDLIEERIDKHHKDHHSIPLNKELNYYIIACEECSRLVFKSDANKQKGEVKTRKGYWGEEDYIYYPYYCKECKPKENK